MIKKNKSKILLILAAGSLFASAVFLQAVQLPQKQIVQRLQKLNLKKKAQSQNQRTRLT